MFALERNLCGQNVKKKIDYKHNTGRAGGSSNLLVYSIRSICHKYIEKT